MGSCGLKSAPRYLSTLGLHVHSIRQRKREINAKVAPTHGEVEVGGCPRYDAILTVSCRVLGICPDSRALDVVMRCLAVGQPFSRVVVLSLS